MLGRTSGLLLGAEAVTSSSWAKLLRVSDSLLCAARMIRGP